MPTPGAGGAIVVIIRLPGPLVKFCNRAASGAKLVPLHIRRALAPIIVGLVLMTNARRSLTALSNQVVSHECDKSTTSRLFRDRRFRTRDILMAAARDALAASAPAGKRRVDWLLSLDGTATQRGAETLIRGAIESEQDPARKRKCKKTRQKTAHRCGRKGGQKKSSSGSSKKKGRRTKYHTFLVGIITTHTGVRIPVGRYTCDPKGFNRCGRPVTKRATQMDLAKLLIKRALEMVPENVRLVVVADSYFDCEKLYALARQRHFVLITPTDSNRCFADEATPKQSNGCRIRDYGLELSRSSFSRLDLRRGSEATARYRRYCARKTGPKDRRTYWLHHERRTVAGLGTVGIVFSWKTPVFEPRRNFRKKSFKILFCSDPTWTGKRIVEWYECRWTSIEIVFRELKGQLGFDHYTGQSLEAMERHIDTVLLSFLHLETERLRLINDPSTSPGVRAKAKTARTQGMQEIVRCQTNDILLLAITVSHRSERNRRRVKRFFRQTAPERDACFKHVRS